MVIMGTWESEVKSAIERVVQRHQTPIFTRRMLLDEELEDIKISTDSKGQTPSQTLSRVLQELWKSSFIRYEDKGTYELINLQNVDLEKIDITSQEFNGSQIDELIQKNKLLIPDAIDVSEAKAEYRIRIGQQRLRHLCIENYHHQCAFCDVNETNLLIAAHVSRWADDKANRGNLENVISMCRFHDPLFEYGYFSMTEDFEIELSKKFDVFSPPVKKLLQNTLEFQHPIGPKPNKALIVKHRERFGYLV